MAAAALKRTKWARKQNRNGAARIISKLEKIDEKIIPLP
jgi:hypothetical protein